MILCQAGRLCNTVFDPVKIGGIHDILILDFLHL